MQPNNLLLTLQGAGDLVNEVLRTAARGEHVACIRLNSGIFNSIFGGTRGHMTTTTALGQRTMKETLPGPSESAS
jgi:hypothetical protein